MEQKMHDENAVLRATLGVILADCILEQLSGHFASIDVDDHGTVLKIFTNETVSQNQFNELTMAMERRIDENAELGKYSIKHATFTSAGECAKHFMLQKVAQELYDGKKVQKFTLIAFSTQTALDAYLHEFELLKQTDHRAIGKALNLFFFIPEAPGSVFWLPKGKKIYMKLQKLIRNMINEEYMEVSTPTVMDSGFWVRSGHMEMFGANMIHATMGKEEGCRSSLKPMNCPGHIEVFKSELRSYRDLPFRVSEFGECHRYEPSGALQGLMRMRAFTIDDGHIFCTLDQARDEIRKFMLRTIQLYRQMGFNEIGYVLATRPDAALGVEHDWAKAEEVLKLGLEDIGVKFEIAKGDGAFYGPKIELHVVDNMGRDWQLGTIQLDLVLAHRFGINYIDSHGEKAVPCMLHRAMLGSLERFIGMQLEHTNGYLPFCIAPVQFVICSVITEVEEYAKQVFEKLSQKFDCQLDISNQTLGYKIREHKIAKIPIFVILGKKEMEENMITLEYNAPYFTKSKVVCKFSEIDDITAELEVVQ